MPDVPLRCRCGTLTGVARDISPAAGLRLICYCEDCRAFARFLDRPDILDAAGGTDIFQLPPGRVELTSGRDALAAMHVTPKVYRWYAACCRTPVANTAGPGFPIVGLIHAVMDHDATGCTRDVMLGAPVCRIYERSAVGPLPLDAPPPASAGLLVRRALLLLRWRAHRLHRPNPFFDPIQSATAGRA